MTKSTRAFALFGTRMLQRSLKTWERHGSSSRLVRMRTHPKSTMGPRCVRLPRLSHSSDCHTARKDADRKSEPERSRRRQNVRWLGIRQWKDTLPDCRLQHWRSHYPDGLPDNDKSRSSRSQAPPTDEEGLDFVLWDTTLEAYTVDETGQVHLAPDAMQKRLATTISPIPVPGAVIAADAATPAPPLHRDSP